MLLFKIGAIMRGSALLTLLLEGITPVELGGSQLMKLLRDSLNMEM
ncbi:hypothetical protein PC129_g11941 [Phytophthora cactorum]|uniref:Uncharacterized protein n=1 Tax=Phytophthora cactorum TaxID=29920 RepID=A0A329S0L4_9STRA|nr:hypothetical protein Pcac1_g1139 [Phytophthora cactorum]KAG2815668.1 hypothetical protein PC112_g13769 [Phytophthora cactorum]KAG2824239.1 hypothetical protein PC111_g9910 [Phytophthora cactorum]KAG2853624.1 hypothetical protein PC113_g14010 [Phytophthora cactorum]KAG2896921.1 hypothetical protein PC114_g14890 [Phytophthora cactorum]